MVDLNPVDNEFCYNRMVDGINPANDNFCHNRMVDGINPANDSVCIFYDRAFNAQLIIGAVSFDEESLMVCHITAVGYMEGVIIAI